MVQPRNNPSRASDVERHEGLHKANLPTPALALLKAECDAVLKFLKFAHERQIEHAKQAGVERSELHAYVWARNTPDHMKALEAVQHSLQSVSEGRAPHFEDYVKIARDLRSFYRSVADGREDVADLDKADRRLPGNVAVALATTLAMRVRNSPSEQQPGETLLLLNALAAKTAGIRGEPSAQVTGILSGCISPKNRPFPSRAEK